MPDFAAVRQAQSELSALLCEYDQVRYAYRHGSATIYDVDRIYTEVCAARRHLAALRGEPAED